MSLVVLGFGIYALASDNEFTDLFTEGSLAHEKVTSKVPELILVGVSAIIVLVTFLGCCGAIQVNEGSFFIIAHPWLTAECNHA